MGKTLVLAEKPSVGRDIARALGAGSGGNGYMENRQYLVTWALGHLITLADPEVYHKKYEKWVLNDLPIIPDKLRLVVIGKTAKQFKLVKSLLERQEVTQIVIATDAGREGELVARWILEKAGVRKPVRRLWISSVTEKAIREGFQKLKDGKAYENLYHSAAARAEADWLVGINATRALTTKYNAQLSCGRVQTPTLAMIQRREKEIQSFKPKTYYGITATVKGVTFHWQHGTSGTTFDEELCRKTMEKLENADGKITEVKRTAKKSWPPLLYDLTQLQADASRIYGYSPKETLNAMQSLYESHKALTYPRTDSRYLTDDIVDTLHERIRGCAVGPYRKFCMKLSSAKFSKKASFVNNAKVSDHHAIIPTEESPVIESLDEKERKIYDLVVKRFLAVLYPPCEYEQTEIQLNVQGEILKAKGKRIIQPGFKELNLHVEEGEEDGEELQAVFTKGELTGPFRPKSVKGQTKPPAHFTEASLLNAMENPSAYMDTQDRSLIQTIGETGGLGTVATRADIIEKLYASFVIEKKGKEVWITQKGRQLLELAPKDLTSPMLTAQWEQRLSGIAAGRENQKKFLEEITDYTRTLIQEIKSSDQVFRHDNVTRDKCPECGKFLLSVNGKKGKMLVCQDRECGYRKSVSLLTNARCPQCHKRMELIGDGEKRKYICICGHKESWQAFQDRREKEGRGVNKKDVQRYLQDQKKKDTGNNIFASLFSDLDLDQKK